MAASSNTGRFVWYDLKTKDPAGGIDFYTKLVGWGTTPWEGGDLPYTMWTNADKPLGGVAELPAEAEAQGAPPHWIAYVAVPDVKVTAARTEELGGKILHPATDIPGAGCFAILQDPQGAVFAAYHQTEDEDTESAEHGMPGVGEFSWHELATTDHAAAFAFYTELFGWEKGEAMDMGPEAGIYQLYVRDGMPLGGMFNKPDEWPACGWLYYVSVDDVTSAVKRVAELGGTVLNGPIEVPGGDLIAQCTDPQGAVFALHSKAGGGE